MGRTKGALNKRDSTTGMNFIAGAGVTRQPTISASVMVKAPKTPQNSTQGTKNKGKLVK